MNPSLVEPSIKYVLNNQLNAIKQMNDYKQNLLFNLSLFVLLVSIIGITLKLKYKGKHDIISQKIKEHNKKHYILSNLRKYQNRIK